MAQKKRTTARRGGLKSVLTRWLGRDSKVVVFVLLFAAVGAFLLIRSFAQSDYPTDPESIVAAYANDVPTVESRDPTTGTVTYQSYGASFVVLGDGGLQCDNGNASGAVTVGQLSQADLKKLHSDLVNLNLSTVPHESAPAGETAHVNNVESFLLAAKGSTAGYVVYKGGTKSDKLARLQAKLLQACQQATTPAVRGKTRHVKTPKLSADTDRSVLQQFAELLTPKVSALPAANGSTIDKTSADDQYNRINQARASNGKPAYTRQDCLNTVAYNSAQRMANAGAISHDPNLGSDVDNTCTGTHWTLVGENVGRGGSSSAIFDAFMNSATHKANILGNYRYVGTGAYKSPDGTIYVAQEFATW